MQEIFKTISELKIRQYIILVNLSKLKLLLLFYI